MKWDTIIKSIVAFGGGVASYLFGGWTPLLGVLLAFVTLDYLSGVAAAGKEGRLSSNVGLWGIAKKISIFAIVAVAHLIDQVIVAEIPVLFKDAAIFYYLANEVLSITENFGRLGVPIPPVISKAVEVLNGKAGEKDEV